MYSLKRFLILVLQVPHVVEQKKNHLQRRSYAYSLSFMGVSEICRVNHGFYDFFMSQISSDDNSHILTDFSVFLKVWSRTEAPDHFL